MIVIHVLLGTQFHNSLILNINNWKYFILRVRSFFRSLFLITNCRLVKCFEISIHLYTRCSKIVREIVGPFLNIWIINDQQSSYSSVGRATIRYPEFQIKRRNILGFGMGLILVLIFQCSVLGYLFKSLLISLVCIIKYEKNIVETFFFRRYV